MDRRTISDVMREMGRKGGKVGGKRRMESLSKEERSELAKKAVSAREAKRTQKTSAGSAEVRSKKAAAKKKQR